MLSQEQELVLSEYSCLYDIVVPQDNLLRRINALIDFSFVYQELVDKYCSDNGRMAESPIRMFKYLLLKVIYDISDVDVVDRSRYDMSFKYFLGMAPEEDVINPSSLCKFRKLRLKDMDLMNLAHQEDCGYCHRGRHHQVKDDNRGCHPYRLTFQSLFSFGDSPLRSEQLRKAIYDADEGMKDTLPKKNEDEDLVHELDYTREQLDIVSDHSCIAEVPAVKQRLNLLKETLTDIEDHYTTSKDEDARIGHKSEDSSFFGYKTHIAMSDERIITAAVVTSGEKGDGPQLERLVEQSRSNGMEVDTVVGDTAYSGIENLRLAENQKRGFELISKLNPIISNGFRKDEDKFDFNKDAGMFVRPAGYMAIRKARQGKKDGRWNQSRTYYFDTAKCKTCSRRDGCYKEGAKFKTYSISIKAGEQERQAEFQKTPEFKYREQSPYLPQTSRESSNSAKERTDFHSALK